MTGEAETLDKESALIALCKSFPSPRHDSQDDVWFDNLVSHITGLADDLFDRASQTLAASQVASSYANWRNPQAEQA